MADGVCHRHDGQAEGQGHTKKADTDLNPVLVAAAPAFDP
jgi:hypothetical protein